MATALQICRLVLQRCGFVSLDFEQLGGTLLHPLHRVETLEEVDETAVDVLKECPNWGDTFPPVAVAGWQLADSEELVHIGVAAGDLQFDRVLLQEELALAILTEN